MTTRPGNGGLVRRIRTLPEEVLFFGRLAIYGLAIGTVYWFLTYEAIGTVLLLAVGGALGRLHADPAPSAATRRDRPRRTPIDRARRPVRRRGRAPADVDLRAPRGRHRDRRGQPELRVGAWLALAAIVPLLGGFLSWLRAAEAEYRAVEADDAADAAAVEPVGEDVSLPDVRRPGARRAASRSSSVAAVGPATVRPATGRRAAAAAELLPGRATPSRAVTNGAMYATTRIGTRNRAGPRSSATSRPSPSMNEEVRRERRA